ncbi:Alcohol dehydrogenase superfamily, zinc-type [Corchorus capsularis]|uniref:Alcohol dehydrogenase superfamily, zinc-type n=1 Tax=Corchorus capsularis TaxID=210143 RepID=A0A1R3KHR1_COCAP|nr:Alcohol dehydrogenase superfamily, zinc-type [Corchorus capsularis]
MSKSPEEEHPQKAFGYAARDSSGTLSPFQFSRRENGEEDVTLKILYCGVCHSDLHTLKNEWGFTRYPVVPGHEIVGVATKVGNKSAIGTMDYIIDTVSAVHPLLPLLSLLKVNGKLVTVGLPNKPLELPIFPLVLGRKLVGGSDIGGMKETQEMIDFCAKHNISADIELIRMDEINTAMDRLAKSDVRYRFVIDVANSLSKY